MRGGLILCLAALHLAVACADPASLQIMVEVSEPAVTSLEFDVTTGAESFISCELDSTGEVSGTCPFEEGGHQWRGEASLSFVLYGEPYRQLTISARGLVNGEQVTSAELVSALPSGPGILRP